MTQLFGKARVHGFPTITHGSIAFEMFLLNVLAEQESLIKELEGWQKNETGLNEPQAEIAVWFPILEGGGVCRSYSLPIPVESKLTFPKTHKKMI